MVRTITSSMLIIFFIISSIYATTSIVTELSVKSQSRGLVFIIKTDRPIDESFQNSVNVSKSLVTIKLFNVTYGLDKLSFTNLSENSPIENIRINDRKSYIQFHINFYKEIKNKTKTKYRKNQIHYFLSDAAHPKMEWTYPEIKKRDNVNREAGNIYSINRIDLVQDGNIEKLIINLDSSVQVRTQNRKDVLIAVFENAINGFSQSIFTLPDNSLFKKVIVKESSHDGLNVVGLILYKSIVSMFPVLIHRKSSKLSVYTIQSDLSLNNHLTLWSSDDIKNTTDRIKVKQQVSQSISTYPDPTLKRVVIVSNKAAYRSTPSVSDFRNIIDSLFMGDMGTLVTHHRGWYFVHFDNRNDTGWVSSTHTRDSVSVTKRQWRKIAVYKKKIEQEKQKNRVNTKNLMKKDAFVQSVEKIAQIPKIVDESKEKFKKMTKYRIYGRDPYLPLNNPEFIESDLPNIEQCKLVGILFDENIKVALIENIANGEAFALEENSDILNGRVLKINKKNVTFLLSSGGYSQRYVMNLQSNKSKDRYEKKRSEK